MKREDFVKVGEEALDLLPEEFRNRIQNVAILVEDFPPQPVTTPTRTAKAIASQHLPWRASDEEERF